ncbi:MAG: tRNA uridine-5-carboxymethylaminomethyl(34) synthesis GTPase MnmE [Anaerolineae bacterium]
MHFIHRPYQAKETIAAIATPPGEGGIAVIRISGSEALAVAEKLFSGPVRRYQTHTAHFGKIIDSNGQTIDEGLLLVMLAPKSYTGEDTIELHCHGGSLVTRKVLDRALEAGARAALPGEFTFKAFMNGKIDLSQAEAVQQLIAARSEMALSAAEEQLRGSLSQKIKTFQKELVDIAAILEAWVDFPEEGLEFASMQEVIFQLESIREKMSLLSHSFHQGKMIHEGLSLCLVGSPNVGKSCLMNALLGHERAIVTDIAGTTRDVLEEDLHLAGLHFKLVDTAGIRDTQEVVEQEGIRRTRQALEKADLILLVLDATAPVFDAKQEQLFHLSPPAKTILVWNKTDLAHPPLPCFAGYPFVKISAKEKTGLENLQQAIEQVIWRKGPPSKEEVVVTKLRHKQALDRAVIAAGVLIEGLTQGVSPEFLSSDMRQVLQELGTIIGVDITEEILSAIFAKFCIGK